MISLDGPVTALEGSNGVILLDRDGVLNVDRADSVKALSELEIERGAVEGCARASTPRATDSPWSPTSRQWVAGSPTTATVDAVNIELDHRLGEVIDAWYVCDHAPEAGCACRKPGTLLLEQARDDLGFAPADTWFVVDADRDVVAAQRFGCRPAIVRTGKGALTASRFPDVPSFDDLADFAASIS